MAYRVDVEVGPAGKLEEMKDVRRLDVLPSKQNPVVAFLGVSENAKRASFLVSSDVTDTDGEGTCLSPRPAPASR